MRGDWIAMIYPTIWQVVTREGTYVELYHGTFPFSNGAAWS